MLFSEFAQINPKVDLEKGETYSFIEMEDLTPGQRYISAIKEKKFKGGGSRFQTGDIIFARITPCLENGKIAQVKGRDNEKYFGSTEFFVFRAIEGISDKGFLFYLSYSDILRKPAEKSMYGASGRQRASLDVLKGIEAPYIPFKNQQKISSILSAYDDLIEDNTRRIQILEEIARLIYQEWFVNFRFPGHEKVKFVDSELGKIPEEWEVKFLSQVFDVKYGKNLPLKKIRKAGKYPVYGAGSIIGFYDECVEKDKVVLITCRGNSSGTVWRTRQSAFITNNSFRIRPKPEFYYINYFYAELLLKNSDIDRALGGSAQPQITIESISYVPILIPQRKIIEQFVNIVKDIPELVDKLYVKKANLRKSQDLLLPKLISGELDVSDLEVAVRTANGGNNEKF